METRIEKPKFESGFNNFSFDKIHLYCLKKKKKKYNPI